MKRREFITLLGSARGSRMAARRARAAARDAGDRIFTPDIAWRFVGNLRGFRQGHRLRRAEMFRRSPGAIGLLQSPRRIIEKTRRKEP